MTSSLPDVELYRGAVEVAGYDDIETALRGPELGPVTDRTRHAFLEGTLNHTHGEEHQKLRRLHSNLFRKAALEHYEQHVIANAIERSLDELRAERDEGGTARADLVELGRAMSSDMACRLIGLGDLADPGRRARFLELSALLMKGMVLDLSTAPPAERAAQLERALAAMDAFRDEFVGPVVAARRRDGARPPEEALDLLALLLASPDASDEMILRNCLLYVAGSQGTVVQVVVSAVDQLARWVDAHPERAGDLRDPGFLRAAVCESLRLSPRQGILIRVAEQELELAGGRISAGTRVGLNIKAAQRDEAIFGASPDALDPGRVPARAGAAPFGLAFGAGRHACIGRRLALPTSSDDDTQGIVVRILHALYAAGIEPDRAAAPVAGDNVRGILDRYPVVFTTL